MKAILVILTIFVVGCSEMKSQLKLNDINGQPFKVIKIDSTKNMYLIQIQNNKIKELIVAEKDCKVKVDTQNKIEMGKYYSFKIDPLDAYFNDDDFQKFGFMVEDVDVKTLTEGTIYTSDSLCGLYIFE
jgi:hypothetical protein